MIDEIIAVRDCGVVRCGLSAQSAPTLAELAREFGLRDDPACYREIEQPAARRLARLILHKDLAYGGVLMSGERAAGLADPFLEQFGRGARFFTNGTWHEEGREVASGTSAGPEWLPATGATFDTGLLILGARCAGCLWVEDED